MKCDERHISFELCKIVTVISQFWQQLTEIFIFSDKTDIESPDSSIITSSAANNIYYHDLRAENSFHTFNRQKKVRKESKILYSKWKKFNDFSPCSNPLFLVELTLWHKVRDVWVDFGQKTKNWRKWKALKYRFQ